MSETPPRSASQSFSGAREMQEPDAQTASGESLGDVLSSIREAVTLRAESGAGDHVSSLALAFDDLRREIARLRANLDEKTSAPIFGAAELEALITKIAQPMLASMLKTWLDRNLPPLAEQVIREEIEKLSRRSARRSAQKSE